MLQFRKIQKAELEAFASLSTEVINNLERKEFFIPFYEKDYEDIFDENKIILYGAYDEDKLVGTAQLFISENYVAELKENLNMSNSKIAKLGRYLVLPDYRNRGIIKQLQRILIEAAKQLNYDYITIIAHPENIYSNKAILSTGAELKKVFITNSGYTRNLYLLNL